MWLEDLALHVRSGAISGIGDKVFIYTLKESDVGAMLTSHNTGVLASNDIPDYYKGALQLIVRSNNPQAAHDQAKAISDYLNSHQKEKLGLSSQLTLSTVVMNYIYPRHLPVVYPRSDGDFFEASVNFDICFVAIS